MATSAAHKKHVKALMRDILMIVIGAIIAILLSRYGLIDLFISIFRENYIVASFLAGIFFTSVFTLAPASITLVHIAENAPMHGVAVWGGLGAMCGDLILFFFIRDRFAEDVKRVFKPSSVRVFFKSFHLGFMRWLSPILGALIIASPLPDEFGITLLGMSKIKLGVLIPIAFAMNTLGIYLLIEFSKII